ncbi:MAG: hemerythrin domain-containing protein [Microthrixaceae bacterium]
MCDYCGCRESGPTAELAAEHVKLQLLSERLKARLDAKEDISDLFTEFTALLEMHAAKEEVGLFPKVNGLKVMDDQIAQLIAEHEQLHEQLGSGPVERDVRAAIKLLSQHIDDEEFDLFPHVIHALDPEDWDEIELAHRAVESVFLEDAAHSHDHPHDHPHDHTHDGGTSRRHPSG